MPTFQPQDAALRQHIEHYWIVDADEALAHLSEPVHEFTSLAPELVLGIQGMLGYVDQGQAHTVQEATFFGHIEQGLTVHPEALRQMVVVRFKPRGVSSMLPFVQVWNPRAVSGSTPTNRLASRSRCNIS